MNLRSRDILIGIDAGTSVIKAVAFDLTGRQLAIDSRRNSYATLPNGGAEQDMARTWADTATVLRGLSDQVDGLADRVLSLGVTGQGDGCWLIDAEGHRSMTGGSGWMPAPPTKRRRAGADSVGGR